MSLHESRMLRHPVVFRRVQVVSTQALTPNMHRIVVGGDELAGFVSGTPDDHIKLFFPNPDGEYVTPTMTPNGPVTPEGQLPSPMRDYTPRHYDAQANQLTLDFVRHGEGPATRWAERARPGDTLAMGGPRGSFVAADDFDHYVLLGDETALPAIGRWLEEMPDDGRQVQVFIEIPEEADRQDLHCQADAQIGWLERNGVPAATSTLLEDTLRDFDPPEGDAFYWIACESRRARMLRKFLEGHLQVPKDWIRATGYWKHDAGAEDGD